MSIGVTVSPDHPCDVCKKPVGDRFLLIYGTPTSDGDQLLRVAHDMPCGPRLLSAVTKACFLALLEETRGLTP